MQKAGFLWPNRQRQWDVFIWRYYLSDWFVAEFDATTRAFQSDDFCSLTRPVPDYDDSDRLSFQNPVVIEPHDRLNEWLAK